MITSISIQNWKGHKNIKIYFNPGVNFLVGPNGVGKTSILDAITFSLLGNIGATEMYKSLDYRDLIRNSQEDMNIALVFNPGGKGEYLVKRTHSAKSNRKNCVLSQNGNVISRQWEEVTETIINLYNTSDIFLRRVILLSEGDTFAYATKPPGEGLTKHIEKVLGINRLENFRDSINIIRRKYDAEIKENRSEIKNLSQLSNEDKKSYKILPINWKNFAQN